MMPKKQILQKDIRMLEENQDVRKNLISLHNSFLKIPKKPFFRIVKYEHLKQVELVRTKLWKISSCNLRYLNTGIDLIPGLASEDSQKKTVQLFNLNTTPTMRKSLKHVRKVNVVSDMHLFKFFSKSWRIEEFKISFYDKKFPFQRLLKQSINHKLKKFTLEHWQRERESHFNNKYLIEAVCYFPNLEECVLQFPYSNKGEKVPSKLYRLQKLQKLTLEGDSSYSLLVPDRLKELKKLEELILPMTLWNEFQDILSNVKSIPNLKVLSLHFRGSSQLEGVENLSVLVNCPKLESLTLFLERVKNYSLDFLLKLENLKELCFKEIGAKLEKNQERRKFPRLDKLKKFTLFLRNSQFCLKSIRDILEINLELKELDFDLSFPEISELFKDNLTLPIESLILKIPKTSIKHGESFEDLTCILQRHCQLRKLSLTAFNNDFNIIHDTFNALPHLTLLEELELIFPHVGKQDRTGKEFQKKLFSLPNLKVFIVDIKNLQVLPTALEDTFEGLMKMENLKEFVYEANFDRFTPSLYESLVKSIRVVKNKLKMKILLYGYTTDFESESSKFLRSENSLWQLRYVYA